jgi:hypothetical protein
MQTIHPAIITAANVYDLPGDLAPYQEAFHTAVNQISMRCSRTKGVGILRSGDLSDDAMRTAYLADRQMAHDLDRVLEAYELAHELAMEEA